MLAASLDFNAIAVQDVQYHDRASWGLIQDVIDIQIPLNGDSHYLLDIWHPDMHKAVILQNMQEPSQHLLHIVPVVVLEVM